MELKNRYEVMRRKEAATRGLFKYYTGKLCGRGHDSLRYTKTGQCIACQREYNQEIGAHVNAVAAQQKLVITRVHPEDEEKIRNYAEALNLARKMSLN